MTMKQLQVFVSTHLNKHLWYLEYLFINLTNPAVPQPIINASTAIEKDLVENEVEKEVLTDLDKAVFAEKIKQWIKEEAALHSTRWSLYTIIIEQCSELMQNRLIVEKNYETMKWL